MEDKLVDIKPCKKCRNTKPDLYRKSGKWKIDCGWPCRSRATPDNQDIDKAIEDWNKMQDEIPFKIVKLDKISSSWPNQWTGEYDDGSYCAIHAKAGLSIYKADTEDGKFRDEYTILECDLPSHLESWHDLTLEELIDFCKEIKAPVEFDINKEV